MKHKTVVSGQARVLVTGATGFVGQNLVPYLTMLGFDVVTVGRKGCMRSYDELRNDPLLRGSIVVHLAGRAHDTRGGTSASQFYDANVKLTEQVFDLSESGQAEKFIFVSSIKAVADEATSVIDESTMPHPNSPYGISKLKAEEALSRRASVGAGMELFILRPVVINGPGVKGNISLLAKCAEWGAPYPFGGFANRRSMLAVDNLSYVIARICVDSIHPSTYIVADDESMSSQFLFEVLCNEFGKRARCFKLPRQLVRASARAGSMLNLPLNVSNLEKLLGSFEVSNIRLLKALDVDELPYTARDGVRSCVVRTPGGLRARG